MITRLLICGVVVTMCGACGAAVTPSSDLYTVTSTVMQKPGEAPHACFAQPLPEPPIGCGGPALAGADVSAMPGFTRYRNGVEASRMVRLIGTWDGRRLVLERPPEAAANMDQTPAPSCAQDGSEPQGGTGLPPMMQRVADDNAVLEAQGIQVLEMYMCKQTLFMVVPVADQATQDFLTSRYGGVRVAGWLQRVS